MEFYIRSREDEIEFNRFTEKVDNVYNNLRNYENEIDLFDISSIKKNFITKTNDFFREDRKFNIGIIGRVKVGKSTFLNNLLFDGRNILPTAVTPKTAALTRIEYDDENRIEIDYFTRDEWRIIVSKSEDDIDADEYIVAKEIISMLKERDIEPQDYIIRGHETIRYDSYEELMSELNEYVGENGKYTPIVKAVSALYVHAFFVALTWLLYCVYGKFPGLFTLQVFYYTFCMFLMVLSLSYGTSAITVLFRDMEQLVAIVLQIGVWATPIMWNLTSIGLPKWLVILFKMNPMYYIVYGYRDTFVLHKGFWEHPLLTAYFWAFTALVYLWGVKTFRRSRGHFADVL